MSDQEKQTTRGPNEWKAPKVETIRDRNGREVYRVRKSVNGARDVKRFKTLAAAERYIKQLESERFRTSISNQHSSKIPLEAIYSKWLNHVRSQGLLTGGTQQAYTSCFSNMRSLFSNKGLHEITKKDFEDFLVNNRHRWGTARLQRHITLLQYLNSHAQDELELKSDQILQWDVHSKKMFKHIKGKQSNNRPVFLKGRSSIDEYIAQIENYVFGRKWKNPAHYQTWLPLICELAVHTGLRKGECLGLTWHDIDENEELIHVHTGIARWYDPQLKKVVFADVGHTKTRLERDVPINEDIAPVLEKIRARWEQCCKETGSKSQYLFVPSGPSRTTGKLYDYIPYETASAAYNGAMRAIGMSRIKFHKLRHSFITNFIDTVGKEDKNAKKYAQTIAGHKSSATTDKYDHANVENVAKAMKAYHSASNKTVSPMEEFTTDQLKLILQVVGITNMTVENLRSRLSSTQPVTKTSTVRTRRKT